MRYVDSDFAGDVDSQRSTTGYVFTLKSGDVPLLHSDSQSAIDLANNLVNHDRTKHIDVRYHFNRKILKDDVSSLLKIDISQNTARMLTKMVTVEKLKSCSVSVGLQT